MKRRILIPCLIALAVFPVAAQANTAELTYPTGTRLAAGNTLKAGDVSNLKITGPEGTFLGECTTVSVTGALVKNNGTEVESNIETASFSGTGAEGQCTSTMFGDQRITASVAQGLPWCLRATSAMKEDEFQIRGGKCSEASRSIHLTFDGVGGECKYVQESTIKGTFSTEPSDAVLTFSTPVFVKESENPFLCATRTVFDLALTLERDEAGTHPAFLS